MNIRKRIKEILIAALEWFVILLLATRGNILYFFLSVKIWIIE